MARITVVKKARKDQGTCESCGNPIDAGMSYQWCAPGPPRMQRKRKRHASCPQWRPSELTGSSQLATIYGAQEAFSDDLAAATSKDEVTEAFSSAAEQIREAAEMYRESAQNIEDGFGHATMMSEELTEKAEALDSWADDIESAGDDIDVPCAAGACVFDDESDHHEFSNENAEDLVHCTAVEGCEFPEDEHHDYEADLSEVDSSELDNMPI